MTPVILVVYDSRGDRAYWLHIQCVFGGIRRFQAMQGSVTLSVRIPIVQELNPKAVRRFGRLLSKVMSKFEGVLYGDE